MWSSQDLNQQLLKHAGIVERGITCCATSAVQTKWDWQYAIHVLYSHIVIVILETLYIFKLNLH